MFIMLNNFVVLIVAYLAVLHATETTSAQSKAQPYICQSIEINGIGDLDKLRNCTIVVGYVRLIEMPLTATTLPPAFIVEEITDYLLVYRVHGLQTLQRLFPRLRLIRGQQLLFDKYALVVFENRELENLGLTSLLRVQKGDVRIERNPMLCFVDTINWVHLMGNSTLQHFYFKNKPSHQCPLCNETLADVNKHDSPHKHCWNLESYQRSPLFANTTCQKECDIYGCDANGTCCSRRCLTGCHDENCELCATYMQNNLCVDECPFAYFQFNKRLCVSQNDCLKNGLVSHAGACIVDCPPHYEKSSQQIGQCLLPCSGDYIVNSSKDLHSLKECTYIKGTLTIELLNIREKIIDVLEQSLKNIKEITGYLKIKNSPQLVSLQFLSNLTTIKGDKLIDEKYALYVVNNYHLESLWHPNFNVAILKGRIYFHLNPRLCFEKIVDLANSLRQNITTMDVSRNSNGERVICGPSVHEMNAFVEDLNATAARIKVDTMANEDLDVLLGFAHYYKEAPSKNVTRYDGRHGCGHDNWLMDISLNKNTRHVISDLKPYTQYAYFVKTLTIVDYHNQIDAYSVIKYFKTLPSKPGPVAKVYYHTLSKTEIMIHWWPPHSPNGEITLYLVNYEKIKNNNETCEYAKYENVFNYGALKCFVHSKADATTYYLPDPQEKHSKDICQCKNQIPYYSGPHPEDENFYNRDLLTYEQAIMNMVYIPRPMTPKEESSTTNASKLRMANTTVTTNVKTRSKRESGNQPAQDDTTTNETDMQTNQTTPMIDYSKFQQEADRKAFRLQDSGIDDFLIVKSKFVPEKLNGKYLASNVHQTILEGLDPEVSYRISVRACFEKKKCGAETVVLARTISKALDDFVKSAQNLAKDVEE